MSADIELLLTTIMGRKIVDSIDFPLKLHFPQSAISDADERDISSAEKSQSILVPEVGRTFETVILEAARRLKKGIIDDDFCTPEQKAALKVIADAIQDKGTDEADVYGS